MLGERVDELAQLLGPLLQVVVHRRDEPSACVRDPAQRRERLTFVRHQIDGDNRVVHTRDSFDHRPRVVRRRVVHDHDLTAQLPLREERVRAAYEFGQ